MIRRMSLILGVVTAMVLCVFTVVPSAAEDFCPTPALIPVASIIGDQFMLEATIQNTNNKQTIKSSMPSNPRSVGGPVNLLKTVGEEVKGSPYRYTISISPGTEASFSNPYSLTVTWVDHDSFEISYFNSKVPTSSTETSTITLSDLNFMGVGGSYEIAGITFDLGSSTTKVTVSHTSNSVTVTLTDVPGALVATSGTGAAKWRFKVKTQLRASPASVGESFHVNGFMQDEGAGKLYFPDGSQVYRQMSQQKQAMLTQVQKDDGRRGTGYSFSGVKTVTGLNTVNPVENVKRLLGDEVTEEPIAALSIGWKGNSFVVRHAHSGPLLDSQTHQVTFSGVKFTANNSPQEIVGVLFNRYATQVDTYKGGASCSTE